jgi:hypothetical protein
VAHRRGWYVVIFGKSVYSICENRTWLRRERCNESWINVHWGLCDKPTVAYQTKLPLTSQEGLYAMVCSEYGHCYSALFSACWCILTVVLAAVRVIQTQSTVKLGMRGNTAEKPGCTFFRATEYSALRLLCFYSVTLLRHDRFLLNHFQFISH